MQSQHRASALTDPNPGRLAFALTDVDHARLQVAVDDFDRRPGGIGSCDILASAPSIREQ